MPKLELKRIANLVLGTTPPDESKPLSTSSYATHGTIPKDRMGLSDDRSHSGKQMSDSGRDEAEEKPQMTIFRKIMFFISLQGGIVYVLVLAWWLPCRETFCTDLSRDWRVNLTNAVLTSNIEASDASGLSSLVFSYSRNETQTLASLHVSNGSLQWNVSADFVFRHIFCNFQSKFDADGDSNADGILTAYNQIAAFKVIEGSILWKTTLSPPRETIHRVGLLGHSTDPKLLGVSDAYLYLLDSVGGRQEWAAPLPCSLTTGIRLLGPWITTNDTLWALVCEYGDAIEVFLASEPQMLSPARHMENNIRTDLTFGLLYRRDIATGSSIDPTGDVTRTERSLAASWADRVVMATTHGAVLQYSWERNFEHSGTPLVVRSVVFGCFTDHNSTELAVAVQDEYNTTVYILNAADGRTKWTIPVGDKIISRMDKVKGRPENKEVDTIVAESIEDSTLTNSSKTSMSEPSVRSYFTMHYDSRKPAGKRFVFENIVTAVGVYVSNLSPISDGISQLILAGITDGNTYIRRHVVATREAESLCHITNATSSLLQD